mgnify:CR=1 FL=1
MSTLDETIQAGKEKLEEIKENEQVKKVVELVKDDTVQKVASFLVGFFVGKKVGDKK